MEYNADNLPPDLEEVGKRMSTERPVASDRVLRNVMARAQGGLRTRKSLLWRSSAPRPPRKSIGFGLAALVATVGIAGSANAIHLPIVGDVLGPATSQLVNIDLNTDDPTQLAVEIGGPSAAVVQYADCPLGVVRVVIGGSPVNACIVVLPVTVPANCPAGTVEARVTVVLGQPLVTACVTAFPFVTP